MYIMDLGRVLSKEEIEDIKHTITPVERIRKNLVHNYTTYIDAEPEGRKITRNETVDKPL